MLTSDLLRRAWASLDVPRLLPALAVGMIPAVLLAAVGVADFTPPIGAWDRSISQWLQGPAERSLTDIGFVTDWLFSGEVVLGVAAICCVVLLIRGRWLLALSAGVVFPAVVTEIILKLLIAKPPASSYLRVRVLVPSGVPVQALAHGFPSGHAARIGFVIGWLTLLLVPARYRLAAAVAAAVIAFFCVWTRIYVGDHSLLEIVAGLLLAGVFLPVAGVLMAQAKARRPAR